MPDKIPQIIIQQKYFLWENTVWLWLLKYKDFINLCCVLLNLSSKWCSLRMVFTSDGVVIRSAERYDLVKIKPTESEAEHWFFLWLRGLWSSENCIVGVASRSGRINQWQCSIPAGSSGWFFHFCFRLRKPSFHLIISDGVVNGIRRYGNILILPTPIPLSLWLRLWLRFSIFTWS